MKHCLVRVLGLGLMLVTIGVGVDAQLRVGFYKNTCRMAEFIVKDEVRKSFFTNRGIAAGLVRMHFHDCFVRGCDGSVLLDSTSTNEAEKESPANNPSLRGFEVIDQAKARIEASCNGVVSCADILAFAARDSVEISGGFGYDVPAGRRDGTVSLSSEASANLPAPTFNLDQLTQSFAAKGLTQKEMVTLSGAHTIGRSHCTSFSNRLYNFDTSNGQDPTLNPIYASQLKRQCPNNNDVSSVVPMNPFSPTIMDTSYYMDILNNRGLFTSDQSLLTDSFDTANQVARNARNPIGWKIDFAAAMVKMGQIGVSASPAIGQIRLDCRRVNT